MAVPFIDIKRFEPGFLDTWNEKVKSMSENAQFIGGNEVTDLETNLATWAETKYAIGCANGTDALQLALRAVGVGRGDKVLLPDSTFWATFEAVVNVGGDPYTVDTNPVDLQMDFQVFQEAVEKVKPKAALVVHLYGWGTAKIEELRKFCKEKNVALIEDGAQCFGVKHNGKSLYKEALISTTSFYPAKVLGAAGDGGAVFTNDEELSVVTRRLVNHGRTSHYEHGLVGWNSRLDSLQAAFLNLSLKHLQKRIESRKSSQNIYYKELPGLGIGVIQPPKGYDENGYCNVTLVDPEVRPKIESVLKEKGIGFGNIYPGAMSDQPGAKPYLIERFGNEGNARRISKSVLNFPLFAYMTSSEMDEVLSAIKAYNASK
ncbi:DegT/DnrJ/EryC1/StrS aminotransferase family protein [Leptospira limi]|uniref:DegT/DnrJ/EryC1/StrS family aminotransferase n=1 Tax=Leptospira limi TaxID=2950023 RepID=A0ABT3LW96_9LEPT|nr:DegT/DnrJ/EryC1/StrS family aminotransferase [Leptospira limi]MCW7461997.1 DegT/DnrJ/EryC1/StrS family aminotransferase [Leptospira limi]